ncbi:MAG: S-methyl-5'-thioinosine phosphorylase [Acidimicrobiales bacterium]|jgi:5'-methylthioadenosine phosphorylase|nr:S-methyl-5'-thioinosine phosphorylase [Acidimicrobiales bacterium]MDP7258667.1 S-methyl-5'-thioinosine phosphorylase [Acidimicrobiales bacterium]HCV36532.1 S-methyl-5'-thioinosine phosphorylase [Acidimicrobiaceae bacterium]HJO80218.1 S-methyl-5'-thioinosine phosphorylase [Acidimicrobiales bacterium]|tara:strand:+ start:805 stop:1539 length:735 start_codon:yes stop_codon:yes gene_type:complete
MLGLITGSGFYSLPGLANAVDRDVETPYGTVSLVHGSWKGCPVVFLPRHGADHSVPPQRIPYRANLWALAEAGARAVFATAVSGGINPEYRNGELVLIDQFINFTHGREDTFFDEEVRHTDMTEPYDRYLRQVLSETATSEAIELVDGGVYLCANGPRFETPAEIRMYAGFGGDLVGMTGYPEVVLARELDLPYAAVGVVSNPAAGMGSEELSLDDIMAVLDEAAEPLLRLLGGAAELLARRWA